MASVDDRSTPSGPHAPEGTVRRARVAVALLFLTNGALFTNLLPRLPQLKTDLGLDNAGLGTALAGFSLGALVCGLLASPIITRFRSGPVASGGIVLLGATMVGVSLAPGWWTLALCFVAAGAIDAVVDVAQNAHGLRVQRLYGRSIVNAFHGTWSVGAVIGGLMGSAAAGLGIPLTVHLAVAAVLFGTLAVVASRFLLRGPDDSERVAAAAVAAGAGLESVGAGRGLDDLLDEPSAAPRPRSAGAQASRCRAVWALLALGGIAAGAVMVEDAGGSWGALYLTEYIGTGAAVAGLAFVALQTAMTIGRFAGDRYVDRYGARAVARVGGAVAAASLLTALALPSLGTTLAGFFVAGLGVATLVPAAYHAADEVPGLAIGFGLTVVSWLLRVGFLLSPPIVGAVADATSLRVGLLLAPLGAATAAVLAFVLPGRVTRSTGA